MRILVIKLRHLGDVLLTSPCFPLLKKAYPHASIDVVLNKETAPMLEGSPYIDEIICYDRTNRSLAHEISLFWKVMRKKYDLVINMTEGDRGALLALVSKARIKVGVDPGTSGMFGKRRIYTHLTQPCRTPRHTVERHLDLLRTINIVPLHDERDMHFIIPSKEMKHVTQLLEKEGLAPGGFYVVHPASRWQFKCLRPIQMIELIERLNLPVVLSGSSDPKEKWMLEEIERNVKVHNFAGKLSLKGLGALLVNARALITVDSVPLHMASALKTPVVALFGPSCEKTWGPWMHPKAKVIVENISCRPCHMRGCGGCGKSDCLESLPLVRILRAVEDVSR